MTGRDLPGAITRRTRTCRRPQVPRACSVARRQRYTDTTSAERRRRVDDVHADLGFTSPRGGKSALHAHLATRWRAGTRTRASPWASPARPSATRSRSPPMTWLPTAPRSSPALRGGERRGERPRTRHSPRRRFSPAPRHSPLDGTRRDATRRAPLTRVAPLVRSRSPHVSTNASNARIRAFRARPRAAPRAPRASSPPSARVPKVPPCASARIFSLGLLERARARSGSLRARPSDRIRSPGRTHRVDPRRPSLVVD